MRYSLPFLFAVLVLGTTVAPLAADEPPSYAKQVRPFIARYCLECHSAREDQGGLNLETYAARRAREAALK